MIPAIHFEVPPPAIHAAAVVDHDRLVRIIAAVETGNDWSKPGGALQFTPRVWREETKLPFRYAQYKSEAVRLAKQHLGRLGRMAQRFGLEPSVELLAGAWHFGMSEAMKHRKRGWKDYELRVANLYRDPDFR